MTRAAGGERGAGEPMVPVHLNYGEGRGEWTEWPASGAGLILAAWGVHGVHLGQAGWATGTIRDDLGLQLHALGTTKDGHPRHPLYMPKSAQPQPYPAGEA